jgi:WD40 repeat protein/DNA-binding SARP family transcriptional activator
LLAALLVHANEVVSTDRLLDLVWGEEQPDVGALRYQVSKLRETLQGDRESGEEGVIATESPGYVLRGTTGQIDALGFESLLDEARLVRATDPAQALHLLDEALELWRGPAYDDFAYEEFARLEIVRLEEKRLAAMEDRFDALLALGRDREIISALQALVEEHPHRERLTGALMLALYRSGRQADALAAYQALRSELGEGLGIEPSKELVDLEERILLQDETLVVEAAPPAAEFLRGYALRGRIGEGAHGIVWRAAQPGVGREVAIKAIHPDIANRPGFIRRFEMEAQLVASLEHPHIVSLFDFWRDPEGAYLVMPHLRGGNLAHLLSQGPLQPDAALELIEAVGGALSYAHRRGVVHRDVTPQNVLLDDEGHPYLADFGVAALIGETGPPTSSSPAYLAPEQHEGRGAVPESDIYSLGVLAHSVLTGEIPMVNGPLHPVSSLNPDFPTAVDEVIARATAVDVAERYLDPGEFVAALAASLNGSGSPLRPAVRDLRNPYKGLRAFNEADSPDFFGRDVVVSELIDAVARHRLVAVVGPSGCGKSSLVRAGLIADLRRGALPGSERWLVTDMYPGTRPRSELEEALLRVAVERPTDLFEQLARDDVGVVLGGLLPRDAELLLVVDQFEELFTLTTDEEERRRFLAILGRLATDPGSRVRVIVTLRADFYDRPLEYAGFGDLMRRGLVSVTVPSEDSLAQAIVGPAESVGLSVEPGLERVITRDVADQPGGLPLLEFALTELFHQRDRGELTAAGYQRTGGVLGALGRRAEDLFAGYHDDERAAIRQVFLRLVTVDEGAEDTRRRIPLTELHEIGIEAETLQRVLDDYGSHRLITFDRDPETRAPTVEVAHEALLSRWDRLRSWIDERRDDLVLHRRLAAAVREWHDSEWSPAYLFSGGRLDHYETFAEETDIALTDPERSFLVASREAEDGMLARRRRRRMGVLAAFASAAVIAAVLAVVAFLAQRQAEDATAVAEDRTVELEREKATAEEQRALAEEQKDRADTEAAAAIRQARLNRVQELAVESRLALATDPELGVLLALEAVATEVDGAPLKEAVEALHESVTASRIRFSVPGHTRGGIDAAGQKIIVSHVASGEPVTLHDAAAGDTLLTLPVSSEDDPEDVHAVELAVAISPDGMLLATGRADGTIALWDAATGVELFTTNDVQSVWMDAASERFVLAYGTARTESLPANSTPAEIERALEGLAEVGTVNVTGAGSAEDPWQVIFEETSGGYVRRLTSFTASVHVIESGSEAGLAIWTDAESGSFTLTAGEVTTSPIPFDAAADQIEVALAELLGIPAVSVSGQGTESQPWEAVGAADDTGRPPELVGTSIDLSPGAAEITGRGHDHPNSSDFYFDAVQDMEFSPDGTLLASRAWDGTIRLWNVASGDQVLAIDAGVPAGVALGMAFSADGSMLASPVIYEVDESELYETRVWEVPSGRLIHALIREDEVARDVSFLPDGRSLAVAYFTQDRGLAVWDLETETARFVAGGGSWLKSVAVSADGTRVATGDDGGVIIVSELSELGDQVLYEMMDSSPAVWDLAFAAEGLTLLSVTEVTARLWDLGPSGSSEWLTMRGSRDGFLAVAFSPDGSLFARGPDDGAVVIADVESGDEVVRLNAEIGSLKDVVFSPDGRTIATATDSDDGMVQVWDIETGDLLVGLVLPGEGDHDAFAVDFSPDGSLLAASIWSEVRVWGTTQFEEVLVIRADDPVPEKPEFRFRAFHGLDFSPDGTELAVRGTIDDSDFVQIYDLSGQLLQVCCEHLFWIWYAPVEYGPDGSELVTAGLDWPDFQGTIRIWDLDSGEALATLLGHPTPIVNADYSSDGSVIASGAGPDVRLWDARSYEELVTLNHGEGALFGVALSPDGKRLVTSADTVGTVRVWALDVDDLIRIAESRLTRTFTAAECEIYKIESCPLEE